MSAPGGQRVPFGDIASAGVCGVFFITKKDGEHVD
jgi:hypothetical protein